MGVKFETTNQVEVPVETLLKLMTDPHENEAIAREFGALEVRAERTDRGSGQIELSLYEERMSSKSGPEKATITMQWDLENRQCRWSRKDHVHGDRVKAWGTAELEPRGDDATVYRQQGEVEISVPILGTRIAKKIAARMELRQPERCRYWEERARDIS